jgi:hypothetical protein
MKSKASQLREFMASGDWESAFRLASSFQDLGKQRNAILDARTALTNPRFLKQIGKDVEQTIAIGQAALKERYPAVEPPISIK